jgi:hypothetical protein
VTDLDRFRELFTSCGIEFTETAGDTDASEFPVAVTLVIRTGCGYASFHGDFYFDSDGDFLEHGLWE